MDGWEFEHKGHKIWVGKFYSYWRASVDGVLVYDGGGNIFNPTGSFKGAYKKARKVAEWLAAQS